MGTPNSDYVAIGKPADGGGVYFADYGTTMPTSITAALTDFTCVGYVSEDGLTESTSTDVEDIVAWGGDTVMRSQTSYTKEYSFSLIETNSDSLRLVWGDDNVSVANDGTITVSHNTTQRGYVSIVVDMVLNDTMTQRIVIPKAQVTEVGDISYVDGEAVAYELTVTAFSVDGNCAYDYIAGASASA